MPIFCAVSSPANRLGSVHAFYELHELCIVETILRIPGAIGSLLSGLVYSLFTYWGWFKHRWITVNWCINPYGVISLKIPLFQNHADAYCGTGPMKERAAPGVGPLHVVVEGLSREKSDGKMMPNSCHPL
jgi:hypothetical protein